MDDHNKWSAYLTFRESAEIETIGDSLSVEGRRQGDDCREEMEVLHNSFASPPVSREHVLERVKEEILEELCDKVGCGFEDHFKKDLLVGDETDRLFLEEDFEDLCLLSGGVLVGWVGG
jgi:hypothetical protein